MQRSRHLAFLVLFTVGVALWAGPAAGQIAQITDHLQPGCFVQNPAPSSDATVVVFESTCDFLGSNADGNREIFRFAEVGIEQLTDTTACTNANPATGGTTARVAFDSDCDLTGENGDGSVEVFFLDANSTRQLTNGSLCSSELPSLNASGNTIAFQSDCDHLGENLDRNVEIFRVTIAGVLTQLTRDDSLSGCGCFDPSINGNGSATAFDSDCDLVGENPIAVSEIFVVTPAGVVTQLTHSDIDGCTSLAPSITPSGDFVAFESDCDYAGANEDGSLEIFRAAFPVSSVLQMSDDGGDAGCESAGPSIADGGDTVWYTSFCDPTAENPDGSFEVFSANIAGTLQVTAGESCFSFAAAVSPTTTNQGVFVSTCDLTGANADGSYEVFGATMCFCGAPLTRFATGTNPTASDALYVLRAAVGLKACAACDCDVDGSGQISATDALAALQASVGLPAPSLCP